MEIKAFITGKNIQLPNYMGYLVETENRTETIIFCMPRNSVLDDLDYYLTYVNQNQQGDIVFLTKTLTDNEIQLSWEITSAVTAVAGKVTMQIGGYSIGEQPGEDFPLWLTFKTIFTVAEALDPSAVFPDAPTVFAQYLSQMEDLKEAAESAKTAAETAQGKAESAQDKAEDAQDAAEYAQGKAEDAQDAAEYAQGKAEDAKTDAETAATSADNARITSITEDESTEDRGINTITITYKDGTTKTFTVRNGSKGSKGDPFMVYKTYTSIALMNADYQNVPEEKMVCISSNTEDPDNGKLYVREEKSGSHFTFITDMSGAQGIHGDTGNGISNITLYYATTTTQTQPSASDITSTTIPTMSSTNKYLWRKEVISYTDDDPQTFITLVAIYGDKGDTGDTGATGADGTSVTISSTSVQYQASSSGTVVPTGTWLDNPPSVNQGEYLWTRTIVNYSPSGSTTSYSVSYQGVNGQTQDISGKADKDTDAVVDNLAVFDANGNPIDSGKALNDLDVGFRWVQQSNGDYKLGILER